MINDHGKPMDAEEADTVNNQRAFKTARRRSLSGTAVPSKAVNRKVNFGLKTNEFESVRSNDCKDSERTNNILPDLDNSKKNTDSLPRTSGINNSVLYGRSISSCHPLTYFSGHGRNCQPVSAKMKIKHFLAEHIVRTHRCHHPEYHFHKKGSENNISIYSSSNNESDSQESSNISFSKQPTNHRPKSVHETNLLSSPLDIATNILDRIRNINIQPSNPSLDDPGVNACDSNISTEDELNSQVNVELNLDFPCPEPNPFKLPKVISPSSIAFATTHILTNKPKRQRLAHSISYDPSYTAIDICKTSYLKKFSHAISKYPEFVPEKDKWEKQISGYLDTSTPTGATITAINFGLKRVTETDKYLMITKSSSSCPNEFLEDGISHIEATSAVYQSLMKHSTCYDLMPDSGKVVIIDSQIQIGRAFEAIEDNVVRASPIWSSEKQDFIALLTVNDLVPLLLHMYQEQSGSDHCYKDEGPVTDFSTVTVEKCLSVIPRFRALQSHIIGVTPETNLHSVNVIFNQFHKSVVLVIDSYLSGNPLFLLSGLRTLTYIFYKAYTVSLESCFSAKISSSKLLLDQHFQVLNPLDHNESPCQSLCMSSTGKSQFIIYSSSSIIDVLRAMAESYYCCALIIGRETITADNNTEFVIIDVITMADILNLVKIGKHRDTTLTAAHISQFRNEASESMTYRDPVISCSINESIHHLINLIVKQKASFVLIRSTDDGNSATLGILSAHDILTYIDNLPSDNISIHHNIDGFSKLHSNSSNNKRSVERLKPNSEIYSSNKHVATILDDPTEEMFDLQFS